MNEEFQNIFKTKIKNLEIENGLLKNDLFALTNGNPDNGTPNILEYYVRLRADLVEEIASLKEERDHVEVDLRNENDKLKAELGYLTAILDDMSKEKIKSENKIITTINTNTNTGGTERETLGSSNRGIVEEVKSQRIKKKSQFNPSNILDNNSFNVIAQIPVNEDNPIMKSINLNTISCENDSLAKEYKEKLSQLEEEALNNKKLVAEKDFIINDLNNKIDSANNALNLQKKSLVRDVDNYKQQYLSILTTKQTLSAQYEKLYQDIMKNYKSTMEKTNYDLEKKVMHLEKVIATKDHEMDILEKFQSETNELKDSEIDSLKSEFASLHKNYELMHKFYIKNIEEIAENLAKMKDIYFTREKEFINITNYYVSMVNEYSKPISETEAIKEQMETQIRGQCEEIKKLQEQLEEFTKEIAKLTEENMNMKSSQRMKLSSVIKEYDAKIEQIVSNQKYLTNNINVMLDFVSKIEDKLMLFNAINEDNKTLKYQNNLLLTELKKNNISEKEKEILLLKEQVTKLEKENEVNLSLIKDYAENFKQLENVTKSRSVTNDDIVTKLKNEISRLNNQIMNLNKTKEMIENFYHNEIKDLLNKITNLNTTNDELKSTIKKMEDDFMTKKETVLNLWITEFTEFKDNLYRVDEIQQSLNSFEVQGEELVKLKEFLVNDELVKFREEAKKKDTAVEKLKEAHKKQNKKYELIISNYKNKIDQQMKLFDQLTESKTKEVEALSEEKKKLKRFNDEKYVVLTKEKLIWAKQKEVIDNFLKNHDDFSTSQIGPLQKEIQILEKELITVKEENKKQIEAALVSIKNQITLLKDREEITIKQYDALQNMFENYKDEKERTIKILKAELQNLKDCNILLEKNKNI